MSSSYTSYCITGIYITHTRHTSYHAIIINEKKLIIILENTKSFLSNNQNCYQSTRCCYPCLWPKLMATLDSAPSASDQAPPSCTMSHQPSPAIQPQLLSHTSNKKQILAAATENTPSPCNIKIKSFYINSDFVTDRKYK